MPAYYLGLMSGTSVDGIDAVLTDLQDTRPRLVAAQTFPWPDTLQQAIVDTLDNPHRVSLDALGQLNAALGDAFADAALALIQTTGLKATEINAIGSHGQTLYHAPAARSPFSMQAGDASRIAERTGITTVADFRSRDIAAGGQGAPMVPAFHHALFNQPGTNRAILNIGGIANLTFLPAAADPVLGFDTGPGNTLMDAWIHKHRQLDFDKDGAWAASGSLSTALLDLLMQADYFKLAPPKSTGRELFRLSWLEETLENGFATLAANDVQATLCELTAASVAAALETYLPGTDELYVCGGGAHNRYLMQRLGELTGSCSVATTEQLGLHPDWVEATAFAWLAQQTLSGKAGNLPSVTGADHAAVLGAIHPGRNQRLSIGTKSRTVSPE